MREPVVMAADVKALRERTGAGMMDCKRALEAMEGDIERAIDRLREQGIAKAAARAGRTATEGLITAYVHPGDKLGVLLELNCETDFVGRTETFAALVKDLAMHIAATEPLVVARGDVPEEWIERETKVYEAQALAEGKPERIVQRIVQGRAEKYFGEICLMEQQFVRDPERTVEDVVKETAAKVGENIVVRRFARFRLGEDA
jgi:elongation factor Ts